MTKEQIYKTTKEWYKTNQIKFNMIKYLYNRELALLAPSWTPKNMTMRSTRNLRCHNVQGLDIMRKLIGADKPGAECILNYYYSLAKYNKGIIKHWGRISERDKNKFDEWNQNCWKEIESYDMLIDIDGQSHESFEYTKQSAIEIFDYLDWKDVPFNLRFSGNGFHFIIPYQAFPLHISLNPHAQNNIYKLYTQVAKELHKRFTELIDTSIYDSRRVTKIPYSLAAYKHGCFMCMPINSRIELLDFKLSNTLPQNINKRMLNQKEKLFNETGSAIPMLHNLEIKW